MRDIHDAAVVAAEWWAKKIGGEIHHDNGDNSPLNKLAMLMADSAQKKTDRGADQHVQGRRN